jgi:hypothetical protein
MLTLFAKVFAEVFGDFFVEFIVEVLKFFKTYTFNILFIHNFDYKQRSADSKCGLI